MPDRLLNRAVTHLGSFFSPAQFLLNSMYRSVGRVPLIDDEWRNGG
jgi:hypothetical protein